jgi:hypothetical protein
MFGSTTSVDLKRRAESFEGIDLYGIVEARCAGLEFWPPSNIPPSPAPRFAQAGDVRLGKYCPVDALRRKLLAAFLVDQRGDRVGKAPGAGIQVPASEWRPPIIHPVPSFRTE